MAKARLVSTKFWSDPWVVDELEPLDRYVFLYLLTNEKTNIIGTYELSLKTMANETGVDKEQLIDILTRLDSRVTYVDGWVVFRKMIKHQNYSSPKIEAAMVRELRSVPSQVVQMIEMPDDLRKMVTEIYRIDTVSIPLRARNTNNNTNLTPTPTPITSVDKPTSVLPNVPKKQIDEMLERWKVEMGFEVGNELANRRAIASLIREHKVDGLVKLITGVRLALEDKYSPRISDFVSLKRKQNELLIWGRKRANAGKVVKI